MEIMENGKTSVPLANSKHQQNIRVNLHFDFIAPNDQAQPSLQAPQTGVMI